MNHRRKIEDGNHGGMYIQPRISYLGVYDSTIANTKLIPRYLSHGHMLHSWWHTGICYTPGGIRAYATLSNGHMPHSWCHTRKTYMYADR